MKFNSLIPRIRTRISGFFVFMCICWQGISGHAQDKATLENSFLNNYWEKSSRNEQDSKKLFENAETEGLLSTEALEAYAWNRINHGRYSEAKSYFTKLTSDPKCRVEQWMALSWIQILLGENDAAMSSLLELKNKLDSLPAQDNLRQIALAHLGRIIGFVQGPRQGKVHADQLRLTIEQATNGLPAADMLIFQSGMQEVLDKFDELSQQSQQAKADFVVDAKMKAKQESALIQNDIQRNEQRLADLSPESSRLTDQFSADSAALRTQSQPLQQQLAALRGQVTNLNFDLQVVYSDLVIQQANLANTTDPRRRFVIQNLITQIAFAARDIESQIFTSGGQIRNLEMQLNGLLRQQQVVSDQYQTAKARLGQEEQALKRENARNRKALSKLDEDPKRLKGEASSLATQLTQFSTYYRFPVEIYRQLLLDRLN